jgi:addiction module HigA family antidote
MSLKNPAHPGAIVREDCLGALGLTVTEGARILGISRKALSDIVNEHAGISAEMAIRLSKAFGGTAAVWVRMQAAYDLAQAEKRAGKIKVKPVSRRALARAA